MYKVIIVDDEILVRAGLRSMICWADLDMTVVGEASNGQAGLELYYEKKPDVILTDIKMPDMDGLEMLKHIRERDNITKVIVLSCYDDFALVRKAFQLGITDYIQKMEMFPDDIQEIMEKTRRELLEYSAKRYGREKANSEDLQTDIIAKGREYIMYKAYSCQEFRTFAEELGLMESGLAVAVMDVGIIEDKSNADNQKREYKEQVICSLARELLRQREAGNIFWESESKFFMVLNSQGDAENCADFINGVLADVVHMLQKFVNGKPKLGVSRFADSYEELNDMLDEAKKAEKYAVFMEKDILFYEKESMKNVFLQFQELLKRFVKKIEENELLDSICIERFTKEILAIKNDMNESVEQLKEILVRWIYRVSFETMILANVTERIALDSSMKIRSAISLTECLEVLEKYLKTLFEIKHKKSINSEVVYVLQYVKQHYQEDLSLEVVAEIVGMNKEYLGNLIRKNIGQGFPDYVNQIRILKACELLVSTNSKTYEIAEKVGYKDAGYFSRVFKKLMGIGANEYRALELNQRSEELTMQED